MLTEAQAWRKIARRIIAGRWAKEGLCREVCELRDDRQISEEMEFRMDDRIDETIIQYNAWAYPMGEEPEARALMALLFAVQAEEEYKGNVE